MLTYMYIACGIYILREPHVRMWIWLFISALICILLRIDFAFILRFKIYNKTLFYEYSYRRTHSERIQTTQSQNIKCLKDALKACLRNMSKKCLKDILYNFVLSGYSFIYIIKYRIKCSTFASSYVPVLSHHLSFTNSPTNVRTFALKS